ncbi:MAG: DNA (cytosine-5-)-methyltransferase [Erysipelotrichales bacterium]|nr:DNA (cytosine-5-)-methyltransferase [Erysipelotrichales bacterium]
MTKNFTMVELFSGIGAQAKAFSRVSKRRNVTFTTVNTCEWDIHAIVAYYLIHRKDKYIYKWDREKCIEYLEKFNLSNNGKEKANFATIANLNLELLRLICTAIKKTNNLISVTDLKSTDIPDNLDVLTYSFPCQDLSNVGALHGYNKGIDRDAHSRSGLLWEVERVLKDRQRDGLDMPKFLILENVTALEADRHKDNFSEWKNQLESFGYVNKIFKLDSLDLGIPQHRKRLLMLSVYVGSDKEKENLLNNYFEIKEHKIEDKRLPVKPLVDILKTNYDNKVYFAEALLSQPNATPSRLKIWDDNLKIINEDNIVANNSQTITTKQDRHPNSGNIYFDYENNKKSKYRFLTPRECFLLMGFDESDYNKIISNNIKSRSNALFFSRDKMYKLAGNSIVVNVLEQIFDAIVDIDSIINN